jgi:hypothetical protein
LASSAIPNSAWSFLYIGLPAQKDSVNSSFWSNEHPLKDTAAKTATATYLIDLITVFSYPSAMLLSQPIRRLKATTYSSLHDKLCANHFLYYWQKQKMQQRNKLRL